LFINAFQLVWW